MKHEKDKNEFDIPGSSLSTILKNKDKISKVVEAEYCLPQRKRFKTSSSPEIKQTMVEWMKRVSERLQFIYFV